MEKRLFLNGVALQGSDISYWYLERSAFFEPDLSNTDPTYPNPASVPAGVTHDLIPGSDLAKLQGCLAGIVGEDSGEGRFLNRWSGHGLDGYYTGYAAGGTP